jgi:hypothetical protein
MVSRRERHMGRSKHAPRIARRPGRPGTLATVRLGASTGAESTSLHPWSEPGPGVRRRFSPEEKQRRPVRRRGRVWRNAEASSASNGCSHNVRLGPVCANQNREARGAAVIGAGRRPRGNGLGVAQRRGETLHDRCRWLNRGDRPHALACIHRHRLDVAFDARERQVDRITQYAPGNLLTLPRALA